MVTPIVLHFRLTYSSTSFSLSQSILDSSLVLLWQEWQRILNSAGNSGIYGKDINIDHGHAQARREALTQCTRCLSSKAKFRRRTFHVPNLMLLSYSLCLSSFAFDLAQKSSTYKTRRLLLNLMGRPFTKQIN